MFRKILDIGPEDKILVEFDKKQYGVNGDVDIVVWKNPCLDDESIIAVEVPWTCTDKLNVA
ncbi:MAG: hypothetical protein KZQ97_03345 [Candidatus Thiodiazotropha sp. (ex Dulcina madagascariensis)]|nr:hypothetical protein [Candidatus Thiodiazotropha sp. (ex Dulcina madagascariensis)]